MGRLKQDDVTVSVVEAAELMGLIPKPSEIKCDVRSSRWDMPPEGEPEEGGHITYQRNQF